MLELSISKCRDRKDGQLSRSAVLFYFSLVCLMFTGKLIDECADRCFTL